MPSELFVPFRFGVSLYTESRDDLVCRGAFSEVSGLEMTMEPKVIKEGGRNWGDIQRSGPTTFAPVVLKRGVTTAGDLWSWFEITTHGANYGYRLKGEIDVYGNAAGDSEGGGSPTPQLTMTWKLTDVLPTKFKGPDLSSTASQVAIEELHLVFDGLELVRPEAQPAGAAS